jgi:hypothetical protein
MQLTCLFATFERHGKIPKWWEFHMSYPKKNSSQILLCGQPEASKCLVDVCIPYPIQCTVNNNRIAAVPTVHRGALVKVNIVLLGIASVASA